LANDQKPAQAWRQPHGALTDESERLNLGGAGMTDSVSAVRSPLEEVLMAIEVFVRP
jgi:hypothetical protein